MTPCPCGSGRLLTACCGPLLSGAAAETAEALMRSRYTAFTLANLDYIEKTCTGPAAGAFNRFDLARSLPGTRWLGLSISDRQAGSADDERGSVTFTVRYQENGQIISQSETSQFVKVDGQWRYYSGALRTSARAAANIAPGRNDPCSCGSGKKYKKCCGAG